jgi:hypothetical protein
VKKLIVLLLLVSYSLASVGATAHLHYCMNELVKFSFEEEQDEKCGRCGMTEKKGGCCSEEHEQIKLKADHQAEANTQIDFPEFSVAELPNPIELPATIASPIAIDFPVSHAPPLLRERLYLLHCLFLI